jgi:hypothetical protein
MSVFRQVLACLGSIEFQDIRDQEAEGDFGGSFQPLANVIGMKASRPNMPF